MLKKKKGQAGTAVQYMTRNQALKKLQLKLAEFRRLCILKGVHPREPRKKAQGAHKTYYHAKDIAFLLHEPLLKRVRELAAYDKKVRRAAAKKNRDLAQRLAQRRPSYRLDHLVRERYPSFVDALRDLDDPLTMVHLFSVLPVSAEHGIPPERVQLARRLALEWQAWVVRSGALRKAFVSVKGYYYQAEVQGQAVTWLVPHQLSQVLPPDVDFRVMLTFLELYQTTLQFVLYKLYTGHGMRYPPVLDPKLEAAAAGLQAVMADLAAAGAKEGGDAPMAGQALLGSGSGAGEGVEEAGAGEGRGVNPEAARRLGSLAVKVRELEEEIKGMAGARTRQAEAAGGPGGGASDEEGAEDDEEGFEIDSGNEAGEGGGEASGGAGSEESEGDEAEEDVEEESDSGSDGDPDDDGIPVPVAAAAADEARMLAGGAADVDGDEDGAVCAALFHGLVFFLGREVPREQLLLVIRAFGGEAGWEGEGSPVAEGEERVTHQVVDRPHQGHRFLTREYVQPQWVFDSANARVLVRAELYAPGLAPPPHLSPFVDAEPEGYLPEYGRELMQLREAAKAARSRRAGAVAEDAFLSDLPAAAGAAVGAPPTADEEMQAAERQYAADLARELQIGGGGGAEEGGGDDGGDEASVGAAAPGGGDGGAAGADEDAMKDIMMTRKVKRAYQRATREQSAKKARVEELERKAATVGGRRR